MGKRYLVDTNILIYFFKQEMPVVVERFINRIITKQFYISTITKIEILGYRYISLGELKKAKSLFLSAHIFYVNSSIEEKAIEIRRHKKMSIPDSIIAATALEQRRILITRNEKDFRSIRKLEIFNPFEK
jgi:toxin FitB